MTISSRFSYFLKYQLVQRIFEQYYRYKLRGNCFLMEQSNRWTVVTYNK